MKDYEYYSAVVPKEVEWLWYPYIPYGKITLLQGDPGEGKSTFMVQLAALLTDGGTLPDGSSIASPQNVIYQCAEDGTEDTIKPRLLAAGADCNRIAYILDSDTALTVNDQRIEDTIKATKARMLILDPIQAFIPQNADMQNAASMRSVMRNLADVAERYACAIILVGHMSKTSGMKNLYRGLGSIDIAAIARSVLMIERDLGCPEMRYMFPVKSSLAPEGSSIGFLFDAETGFQWLGKCQKNFLPSEETPELGKKDRAAMLLQMLLSAGDKSSADLFEQFQKLGISRRTLQEAKKELGVNAYQKQRVWYWSLPNQEGVENGDI